MKIQKRQALLLAPLDERMVLVFIFITILDKEFFL